MSERRRAALALSWFQASLPHPVRVPVTGVTPEKIWRQPVDRLSEMMRLGPRGSGALARFRERFSIEEAEASLERKGVSVIVRGDSDYPAPLARIYDPPIALFIAGERRFLEEFMGRPRIAIVGSRAATRYGTDAAHLIAAGISKKSICVVSGMALGIDTVAHWGALNEAGGTVAVLGSGPDMAYPRSNLTLYELILRHGLVVSEYPPGTEPRPWRFPARNRIIAGLSDGVVVVEAGEKSGALITADFCLEQGGEVFAVPGSIFSRFSAGANDLIRSGATAVTSAEDILDALGMDPSKADGQPVDEQELTEAERLVLEALSGRPSPVDILAGRTGLSGPEVTIALTALELKGIVRYEAGRGYGL